jgi:hypothetical protein
MVKRTKNRHQRIELTSPSAIMVPWFHRSVKERNNQESSQQFTIQPALPVFNSGYLFFHITPPFFIQ